MEEKRKIPQMGKRSKFITALLAFVLLIVTLVTPFVYYAPKNRLARAVEDSMEEWKDEAVLQLLSRVFYDGSFEAVGEQDTLSYTATLPKSSALAQKGASGNFRVALQGDQIYVQSSGLGEFAYFAPRSGASAAFANSAFSDAGMPEMQMRLLRTALVLSESDFQTSAEVIKENLEDAFRAGKPSLSAVGETVKIRGKEKNATSFTYEMEKEGLEKALAVWKRAGKREETKVAFSRLREFLSATLSSGENSAGAQGFVTFLLGESAEFAEFEKKLLSENSRFCMSVTVYKERVIAVGFTLSGGDFVLEGRAALSDQLRKDRDWSASLQAKTGDAQLFSLSFGSRLEENSKSALIRKWNYAYSDAIGAICAETGEEKGEIVFSWGKKKDDLGLKLSFGETNLVFRGNLVKYKEGKKLNFEVNSVELDGKKISVDKSYLVSLSLKGETPRHLDATEELFPEGDLRQEFAKILSGRFQRFAS